jgi:hypothetical protein
MLFRGTTWLLAFMVITFSMLGGPASIIYVGCKHTLVEFGFCSCDCEGAKPKTCNHEAVPPEPLDDCTELIFPLEETPVGKNALKPSPVFFVDNIPMLESLPGIRPTPSPPGKWNYYGHPPDLNPHLRFVKTVRLLI